MPITANLKGKIEEVENFLAAQLLEFKAPALMCSFGKDSMTLLWILSRMDMLPPILFFEDPWFPRKYAFAHQVIAALNLTVYDYPPIRTSMLYGKGLPAFVNEYHTGTVATIALPKNIVEYEDGCEEREFLCGLNFFTRPCGTFMFPWDLVLIGHKSCDEDQIYGKVPLKTRIVYRDAGPTYAFPLMDWSHEDIWDYLEAYQVPMQVDRYDVAHRTEWSDKTYNSDYWPACIRCVDERKKGEKVFCPKMKQTLLNVSGSVERFDWSPDYFGEKENGAEISK